MAPPCRWKGLCRTLRAAAADEHDTGRNNDRSRSGLILYNDSERHRSSPTKLDGGALIAMPTYIMLSTLTPEGVQTVKNNPQRIKEVNKEVEQLGASVKAQWATLGHVDFISVVEAPDEATMARVSLELGSRGTGRYETLAAIPVDDFIASL
jgi:uncharacterized protein with GYD domain